MSSSAFVIKLCKKKKRKKERKKERKRNKPTDYQPPNHFVLSALFSANVCSIWLWLFIEGERKPLLFRLRTVQKFIQVIVNDVCPKLKDVSHVVHKIVCRME